MNGLYQFNSLRLFCLDNYYEQVPNPFAGELFQGVIEVRKDGYGPDYPQSFLPVDSTDYFSKHYIFCLELQNRIYPIAVFQCVDLGRYHRYGMEFAIIVAARAAQANEHLEVVQRLIEKNNGALDKIGYFGGFTVRKCFRADKVLVEKIKKTTVGILYYEFIKQKYTAAFTAGVPRFKTERLWNQAGYKMLKDQSGNVLPYMPKVSAEGELLALMYTEKYSNWAEECFLMNKELIESSVVQSPSEKEVKKILSAA